MFHTISSFKAVAFPSGSFNQLSDTVIQNALDVAESEILAACRTHHTLPLTTSSYSQSSELAFLYDAQVSMASYRLLQFRGFKPNVDGTNDQVLKERYVDVVGENGVLQRLTKGQLLLPMAADATPNVHERRPKSFGRASRTTRYFSDDGTTEYI